jgi:hypothetical protein
VLIWKKYQQFQLQHHQASKLKQTSSSRLLMLICFRSNIGGISSTALLALLGVTFILIACTVVGIVLAIVLMNGGEYLSLPIFSYRKTLFMTWCFLDYNIYGR